MSPGPPLLETPPPELIMEVAVTVAGGAVLAPVPVNVIVYGLFTESLLSMVKVAVLVPVEVGVNLTVKEVLAEIPMFEAGLSASANWSALGPVMASGRESAKPALPELPMVNTISVSVPVSRLLKSQVLLFITSTVPW